MARHPSIYAEYVLGGIFSALCGWRNIFPTTLIRSGSNSSYEIKTNHFTWYNKCFWPCSTAQDCTWVKHRQKDGKDSQVVMPTGQAIILWSYTATDK